MSKKMNFREWFQSLDLKQRDRLARLSGYSRLTITKKFATGYQAPRAMGLRKLAGATKRMGHAFGEHELLCWFHDQKVNRHA